MDTNNKITKRSNELVAMLCQTLHQEFGVGKDYRVAIAAACTTLLFHVFRMALEKSYLFALDATRNILKDVSLNLKQNGNITVNFTVEGE